MAEINYNDVAEYVLRRLDKELPPNLYYHGSWHTRDVLEAVEMLAKLEGVDGEELILLKSGALFHDIGFLEQYKDNESIGVRIAKETLPNFGYNREQIEVITGIILATRLPQSPTTKLEELICDADLDNLGREDFYIKTEQLRRELAEYGTLKSPRKWYESLILFLEQHKYFTKSARKLRQEGKEKHLKEIKELLGIR